MSVDDFEPEDGSELEAPDVTAEPEDDLRAALETAFEGESESTEESESVAGERPRDEKGRFAKAQLSEQSGLDPAAPPQTELPPIQPPSSWAAEKREAFTRLPRDLQEEVVRRETDLRRYLTDQSEKLAQAQRTYADLDAAIAPYREQFARAGVTHGQVFNQLMSWQRYLDSNPGQALADLAASYGLDLRQLAENVGAQAQPVPSYVQDMRQQLQQMQGYVQRQQQVAQQQAQQALQYEVQSFASERDQSGQPLRPYLETVMDDMMIEVPALRRANPHLSNREVLQTAYERAVWANPTTRALELQRQQQASAVAQQQKTQQAKRAAKLVNGHAPQAYAPNPPNDLRSALLAAWDEQTG